MYLGYQYLADQLLILSFNLLVFLLFIFVSRAVFLLCAELSVFRLLDGI